MLRLWTYQCSLLSVVLSIFFAGSLAQQWCRDQVYTPNEQRCLANGGEYIPALHCLFELNEGEGKGFIVFNVSQPSCDPSDVVTIFAEDGGSYLKYDETKDAIVVSNPIDVDELKNGGVWEFIEGSINCAGEQKSEAFCFTIELINTNDNLPVITVNEDIVYVTELEIQFVSRIIDNLTIVDVDLGSSKSTLYEIAEKDAPFGLILTKDEEKIEEPDKPGCLTNYAGNEEETKYSLIVTEPYEIDYETTSNYTLTIWAWEGDECSSELDESRSDHAIITVYVLDADDLPPEFQSDMYNADVREAKVNVSLSVTPEIKAEDGDTLGADIEYTLVSDDLDCFDKLEMNKTSAGITVIDEFDYADQKECIVEIQATQVDNPQRSSRVPLIITILPDNTECPTFTEDNLAGFYVNGDPYVLDKDRQIMEIELTDKDLMFEGNITVPLDSLYNETDRQTGSRSVTFKLSPTNPGQQITENVTIEITVSDDYLGCQNNASVFVELTNSDFYFEAQTVYVDEGETEAFFDPPSMRMSEDNCVKYEISEESEGNFTINNDDTRPKIVAKTHFDYETNETYKVRVTAIKGVKSGDDCKKTGTNGTAIITITVVDSNDETPVFKVANTNGVLFEAVFFDVIPNEKIFDLADRVNDADVTASLTFRLDSPDPSPLLSRTDGTVLTDATFDFLRNVNTAHNYTANVTDLNTDRNDAWSSCPLQFGIMGWDQIFIFEGVFEDQTTSRSKRSNLVSVSATEEEAIDTCEEEGKVGWSIDGNILIKIDRIFREGDTYYIWLYGVDTAAPKYLTDGEVEKDKIKELLLTNCQLKVTSSTRTSFISPPIRDFVFVFIAAILFIGIIIMIIFLFYSWNIFLEEKKRFHYWQPVPETVQEEQTKTPEPEPVSEPEPEPGPVPEPEPEILQVEPAPLIPVFVQIEPVQLEPERVHEYEWQEAIMDMQSVDSFSMINLGPEANPGDRDDSSSVTTTTTDDDTEPLIPYATFAHMNLKQPEAPRNEIPQTDYTESKGTEGVVSGNSLPKEEMDPSHKAVMLNRMESTTDPKNAELEHPEGENDRSIRNDEESDNDGQNSNVGIKYADIATDAVSESEQGAGVANEAFESSPPSSPALSPKASPPPPPPPPPPPVSPKPTQEVEDVDPMQDPDDNYQWVEKPAGNALPSVEI